MFTVHRQFSGLFHTRVVHTYIPTVTADIRRSDAYIAVCTEMEAGWRCHKPRVTLAMEMDGCMGIAWLLDERPELSRNVGNHRLHFMLLSWPPWGSMADRPALTTILGYWHGYCT